jgi:hypothetical protein
VSRLGVFVLSLCFGCLGLCSCFVSGLSFVIVFVFCHVICPALALQLVVFAFCLGLGFLCLSLSWRVFRSFVWARVTIICEVENRRRRRIEQEGCEEKGTLKLKTKQKKGGCPNQTRQDKRQNKRPRPRSHKSKSTSTSTSTSTSMSKTKTTTPTTTPTSTKTKTQQDQDPRPKTTSTTTTTETNIKTKKERGKHAYETTWLHLLRGQKKSTCRGGRLLQEHERERERARMIAEYEPCLTVHFVWMRGGECMYVCAAPASAG